MSGHNDLVKQVQERRKAQVAALREAAAQDPSIEIVVKVPTHSPRKPVVSERKPIEPRKEEPVVVTPKPELPPIVLPPQVPTPVIVSPETIQNRNAKIKDALRSYFKSVAVGQERLVLTNPLVKASPEELEQLLASLLGGTLHVRSIEKVRTSDANPDVVFRVQFR